MIDSRNNAVTMAYPGHLTRIVLRVSIGIFFILLTIFSFAPALPLLVQPSTAAESSTDSDKSRGVEERALPRSAGATPLPNLSLPKTTLSTVDSLDEVGANQDATGNTTLHDALLRVRLLGGAMPRDQLVDPRGRVLSDRLFWETEVNMSGAWVPLVPVSSNTTIIGTNSTGTFIVRAMQVKTGPYSGVFRIVYRATSHGRLKWDLHFTPAVFGQFRLVFSWRGIPSRYELQSEALKLAYSNLDYTFSWSDIPPELKSFGQVVDSEFTLFVELGSLGSNSTVHVDPSVAVSGVATSLATASSFQRKVFYEPKGGRYWVFFANFTGIEYSSSPDGVTWSPSQTVPGPFPLGDNDLTPLLPSVYNAGQSVYLVYGSSNFTNSYVGKQLAGSAFFINGTISGSTISWAQAQTLARIPAPSTCLTCVVGIRYVNMGVSSDGTSAFSFNWYWHVTTGGNICAEGRVYVLYKANLTKIYDTGNYNSYCVANPPGFLQDDMPSEVLPTDGQARLRAVYVNATCSQATCQIGLDSRQVDSFGILGGFESVGYTSIFSALSDQDYTIHVVFASSWGMTYSYHPAGGSWISGGNVFPPYANYPSLTLDKSSGRLYAVALTNTTNLPTPHLDSVVMKWKSPADSWSDHSIVLPVIGLSSSFYLGSNLASASSAGSSAISLIWTRPVGIRWSVMFASVPIQTVWSPYSSPSDPWDGNGLAPYGQYFSNLGESVSPSSGMLTIRQTDLTLPGRGLSLDVTRVYTEPDLFQNSSPYNYETYPWAPIGDGWQLNFPWLSNSSSPSYIHLWDGEGYRIPLSFWSVSTATLENHQGEHFRLVRSTQSGMSATLYSATGVSYLFDIGHKLRSITDATGNNTITFGYDSNNHISCLTDTVGRTVLFTYSNALLSSVSQVTGSCTGSGATIRQVQYNYTGQSLATVTDAVGRKTSYQYQALSGPIAAWVLSRITYPTGWFTSYSYTSVQIGTEWTSYRVLKQNVNSTMTINSGIRWFQYNYTQGPGAQVSNAFVLAFDAASLQPVSNTTYAFSFAGVSWNITDSHRSFVRGFQQGFDAHGAIPREIILVSPTMGYTNYYSYDLWGNQIYSRRVINPSANWYHESFSSYFNDGVPPGFNVFQETFDQSNGTATDNQWSTNGGYWMVKQGFYNGTYNGASPYGTFSYADIGRTDISIQARIFLVKQLNSTGWVGIFDHYPGSGLEKWSLSLENSNNGLGVNSTSLVMQDDGTSPTNCQGPGGNYCICPFTNVSPLLGVWYTFNLTTHGASATGWIRPDSQASCSIQVYFSSGTVSQSTGFGLYSAGFSALFDNITVTTVNPQITARGFSDSFIRNGAPSFSVHGLLAGTAEFQNASSTVATETYYGYYPWGGLNQVRQLYNSTSGPQWIITSRSYDVYGNLKTLVDPRGNQTVYGYSSKYQSAYLTGENQTLIPGQTLVSRLYSYNFTMGTLISSVDANRYNTTYQYDILGRVTRVNYPNNLGYTAYIYNDARNYVDTANENGWKTRQIFDGLGRLSVTDRFLNGVSYANVTYTYNWLDKTVSQTDALGNTSTNQYDTLGRITKSTKPDGNTTLVSYNDISSWVFYTDEYGIHRCNTYDRLGRLLSVVEFSDTNCNALYDPNAPGYYVTNYHYDETGNLRTTVTATSQTTIYSYDSLNRLTKTKYPDGTFESYTYDGSGNVASKMDRKNTVTTFSYDSLNRVQTIVAAGNPVASKAYSYDNNGNPVSIGSTNTTIQYTYDARNRVTLEAYSVNGNFSLSVLPNSVNFFCTPTNCNPTSSKANLTITSINGYSGTINLSYVPSNSSSYGGTTLAGVNASVFLPARGKVQTIVTAYLGTQSGNYVWYIRGQSAGSNVQIPFTISEYVCSRNCPTSPTGGASPSQSSPSSSSPTGSSGVQAAYTVGYYYDGEVLASIAYPDRTLVKYDYDGLGRTTSVSTISGVFVTVYLNLTYNKNDQLTYIKYSSGLYANYTYDSLGRTRVMGLFQPVKKSTVTLLSLSYQYNRTGTVATVTGQVNQLPVKEQYSYDFLQRLVSSNVTSNNANQLAYYKYDLVGNRLSLNINNQILTYYSYNATNNELTSSYNPSITYTYDRDGNLVGRNTGTTSWVYTWDATGNLVKATSNGATQGVYAYDAKGRRVESAESSTLFYAYLSTETLYENNTTTKTINDYIYVSGMRLGKLSGGTINYYHSDALGSTRLVTDPSGAVLFTDGYQPFGQDNGTPSSSQSYRFTGKPVSQTTGLYYEYKRWYDPAIGRFISQDSYAGRLSDPESLNAYAYVENVPTSYKDPTGQFFLIDTLLGAGLGAGIGYGWCVLATGGWTSSTCGEYAALGAGTGALAGTTWGLSLLVESGCEAEDCLPPLDDSGGNDVTTPTGGCQCPDTVGGDTTGPSSETTAPKIATTDTPRIISTQGSGDQLSRTWEFDDTTVRVNTGHGFDAAKHAFESSGLSRDAVESAIVRDVVGRNDAGLVPRTPPPLYGSVSIEGSTIEYRALFLGNPDYDLAVATYYLIHVPAL